MSSMDEKLAAVKNLLQELSMDNRLAREEITLIIDAIEEQSSTIDLLKKQNIELMVKLPQSQEIDLMDVQGHIDKFKEDVSEEIQCLMTTASELQTLVLDLDRKLIQIGVNAVRFETHKVMELNNISKQWRNKLRNNNIQKKRIIDEVMKEQCADRNQYEITIYQLKEQVAYKEAEIAWCRLVIKERDINTDSLGRLKKELEVSVLTNQQLLQHRLVQEERRAYIMTRKCLKLQHNYEEKILRLKKEKDLQVQALQRYAISKEEKGMRRQNNMIENAVRELEERYRKIITNLETTAQNQREGDLRKITM